MADRNRVRVAAVQYSAGPDVDANLATTLRMIDQAAHDIFNIASIIYEFKYDDMKHIYFQYI